MEKEKLLLKPMTLINRRGFYGTKGNNANKPFYVVDVLVPLSEEDQKNNSFGYALKNYFLEKDLWLKITPEDIGKQISFEYDSNEYGAPVIVDVKIVSYLCAEENSEEA